jgi:succinate-semialdehyde dehydrogenase/glutarate-semialdehyde dehydrogenase
MTARTPPAYPLLALHLEGRWQPRGAGGTRPVLNPATGQVIGELPLAGADEVRAAADTAARGFAAWRRVLPLQRCEVLRRAAALMRERAKAMAEVLTLEQGKPLAEAEREVRLSADIIDFQAEEARRLYGRTVPPRVPGILAHEVRQRPVGPVAAFTAWNFPVNLPARKLGAALAAGCSVVLKPAEETPASAMALVRCFLDAGLPPEVLSLVHGEPAMVSATLIAHPAIAKVSLTGSVAVGRLLAEQCAREGKRFSGELGGHAPVIVCDDADLDFVLKLSVPAKFRNAGQVCASPIRFFVARRHHERFVREFAAAAAALKLGAGDDPATQMGPLTHERRLEDMQRFVDDARAHGARIVTGGARAGADALPADLRGGFFFAPTVIADAPPTSRVMRLEPFGPIATVHPFDTLDEAIAAANAMPELPYGLAAYAFTRDLETAHRLGEELEAGMVAVNHFGVSQPELPFGGIRASGEGLEMGAEGLRAYLDTRTFTLAQHRA